MGIRSWICKKNNKKIKLLKLDIEKVKSLKKDVEEMKSLKKSIEEIETLKNTIADLTFQLEHVLGSQPLNQVQAIAKNQIEKRGYCAKSAFIDDDSKIGKYTYIGYNSVVNNGVTIGRYCSISINVHVGSHEHPTNWLSSHPFQYHQYWSSNMGAKKTIDFNFNNSQKSICVIGNDVLIGMNVFIKRNVKIGDGAIIGAGSVVTKDVPPYAIAVGSPAKVIKYRFDETTIKKLLELKWWDLEPSDLDGIQFDDINKAIIQLEKMRRVNL